MKQNQYSEMLNRYRAEALEARKNTALADEELKQASGGVGGANEATCHICGKPMTVFHNPYGDDAWTCETCGVTQICSDAETIEIIRYMEQLHIEGLQYPVWWNQVNK